MGDAQHLFTIASVTSATDEADLLRRLQDASRVLGFEYVLAGIEWRRRALPPIQHITSGWPQPYQQVYAQRGLIAVDPTVPHCQTHTEPLEWSEDMYVTAASREVFEESRRFGLHHGLSVPVHENGNIVSMLSLGRDRAFDSDNERQLVVAGGLILANCAHVAIKRVLFPGFAKQIANELTGQELECLKWLAQGKSNPVIADILNISDNTVEFHMKSLFRKLKVTTRVHAAIVAVEMNLV
jgi:DNA-binding CsgD family transcriptional regulator